MTNHNTLYVKLMRFMGSSGIQFHDIRTMITCGWALVGLLVHQTVHLSQWALARPGKQKAASKERQMLRWIHNEKIRPLQLYRPLLKAMLKTWSGQRLFVALDTSQLWGRFVIIRLALVYRGRALPLGWVVCASGSATVHLARYQHMLVLVARCMPEDCTVVLLADRAFGDVKLFKLLRQLGWHYRIRVKQSVWVHRATKKKQKISALFGQPGSVRLFQHVWLTDQRFGPLFLICAHVRTTEGYVLWAVVSDEPVTLNTLDEYEKRFTIEEGFLDDKSAGFQLESSELRDSAALERLLFVMAIANLYLHSTGTALIEMGRRHLVDTHTERGLSYFQIGWRWVRFALLHGANLLESLWLSADPDPEPAMASVRQFCKPDRWVSSLESL
jgi:hypothetical protein